MKIGMVEIGMEFNHICIPTIDFELVEIHMNDSHLMDALCVGRSNFIMVAKIVANFLIFNKIWDLNSFPKNKCIMTLR